MANVIKTVQRAKDLVLTWKIAESVKISSLLNSKPLARVAGMDLSYPKNKIDVKSALFNS